MAILAIHFLLLSLALVMASPQASSYSIMDFGAKPDGLTDSAKPFLAAWSNACAARMPASIHVPHGTFFLSQAVFSGPCNSSAIRISAAGATLVAASGYSSATSWITFQGVNGLSLYDGTFDGRGDALWKCKMAGGDCPTGAPSLAIIDSKDVLLAGVTSLNSQLFHVSIYRSSGVSLRDTTIIAPGDSPNTDGIHVLLSSVVTITGAAIRTGDDCISLKDGVSGVWIEKIQCGPGHGISVGSLGRLPLVGGGVRNVTVRSVVLTGTQNGVRVKTWAKPNGGFVKGVTFDDVLMNGVANPIIVDQNYCPEKKNCPNQSSGIKVSDVSFTNIRGTSTTKVAVMLDCSQSNPCNKIELQDIRLVYGENDAAQSFCRNARGNSSGFVIPPSCMV